MANTIDKQNSQKKKMAAKAALAAAIGAAALSSEANAQDATSQLVDISTLTNVASSSRLNDGSLEVVLDNGDVINIPAGSFIEQAGQFLIDPSAVSVDDRRK